MNVFEQVSANAKALLSEWIKVGDPKNNLTIEDFGDAGVDESKTDGHCWKCVTVNQCWFKNEEGKRPKEFDYSKYSFSQIPSSQRCGLYHPNCHDKKYGLKVPKLSDYTIIEDVGKINFFFKDKLKWYHSWGFKDSDKNEFVKQIFELVRSSYRFGNYEIEKHTKYGFQINVLISIEGKNDKRKHYYNTWSSYMVYPNGQIRLITLIGGK